MFKITIKCHKVYFLWVLTLLGKQYWYIILFFVVFHPVDDILTYIHL